MDQLIQLYNTYSIFLFCTLLFFCFCLLVYCIIISSKLGKLKRKINHFLDQDMLNEDNNQSFTVEQMLNAYLNECKDMASQHKSLLEKYNYLEGKIHSCVQKVGMIRYNPFEEMGGNLCYAVALLDDQDNGVVFNGIHNRSGSFTYAKPIERGASEYVLSDEETEALNMAKRKG